MPDVTKQPGPPSDIVEDAVDDSVSTSGNDRAKLATDDKSTSDTFHDNYLMPTYHLIKRDPDERLQRNRFTSRLVTRPYGYNR